MKNYNLYFDDGIIGGRFKKFFLLSSAIKYALKYYNEESWIYIDNNKIKNLNRLYLKVPKTHYLNNNLIIKV